MLEQLLKNVNGNTIVSICTETTVKLSGGKSNPYQGRIKKVVLGSNVMVFSNEKTNGYEAMVRRRLAAEGKNPDSFELSERAWGVREIGAPFVHHKGKTYLEVIFLSAGEVEFYLDGKKMTRAEVARLGMLEQEEGRQGGLENKVIIRTYAVENIRSITVDGNEYVL